MMARPSTCPTATALTQSVWPVRGSPIGLPVAASHTRTVWSWEPETMMVRPSTCPTATAFTLSVWPVRGSPIGLPVAASHTRTVRSSEPETMMGGRPPAPTATASPAAGVAGEERTHPWRGGSASGPGWNQPQGG